MNVVMNLLISYLVYLVNGLSIFKADVLKLVAVKEVVETELLAAWTDSFDKVVFAVFICPNELPARQKEASSELKELSGVCSKVVLDLRSS